MTSPRPTRPFCVLVPYLRNSPKSDRRQRAYLRYITNANLQCLYLNSVDWLKWLQHFMLSIKQRIIYEVSSVGAKQFRLLRSMSHAAYAVYEISKDYGSGPGSGDAVCVTQPSEKRWWGCRNGIVQRNYVPIATSHLYNFFLILYCRGLEKLHRCLRKCHNLELDEQSVSKDRSRFSSVCWCWLVWKSTNQRKEQSY